MPNPQIDYDLPDGEFPELEIEDSDFPAEEFDEATKDAQVNLDAVPEQQTDAVRARFSDAQNQTPETGLFDIQNTSNQPLDLSDLPDSKKSQSFDLTGNSNFQASVGEDNIEDNEEYLISDSPENLQEKPAKDEKKSKSWFNLKLPKFGSDKKQSKEPEPKQGDWIPPWSMNAEEHRKMQQGQESKAKKEAFDQLETTDDAQRLEAAEAAQRLQKVQDAQIRAAAEANQIAQDSSDDSLSAQTSSGDSLYQAQNIAQDISNNQLGQQMNFANTGADEVIQKTENDQRTEKAEDDFFAAARKLVEQVPTKENSEREMPMDQIFQNDVKIYEQNTFEKDSIESGMADMNPFAPTSAEEKAKSAKAAANLFSEEDDDFDAAANFAGSGPFNSSQSFDSNPFAAASESQNSNPFDAVANAQSSNPFASSSNSQDSNPFAAASNSQNSNSFGSRSNSQDFNPFAATDNPFDVSSDSGENNPFAASSESQRDNPFAVDSSTQSENPFAINSENKSDNPFAVNSENESDNPFDVNSGSQSDNPFDVNSGSQSDNPFGSIGQNQEDSLFGGIAQNKDGNPFENIERQDSSPFGSITQKQDENPFAVSDQVQQDVNPFAIAANVDANPFAAASKTEDSNPFAMNSNAGHTNPFAASSEVDNANPFAEALSSNAQDTNPFASTLSSNAQDANPFATAPANQDANPFAAQVSEDVNTFAASATQESNPFASGGASNDLDVNPFASSSVHESNPFAIPSDVQAEAQGSRPFAAVATPTEAVKNQEGNPFEVAAAAASVTVHEEVPMADSNVAKIRPELNSGEQIADLGLSPETDNSILTKSTALKSETGDIKASGVQFGASSNANVLDSVIPTSELSPSGDSANFGTIPENQQFRQESKLDMTLASQREAQLKAQESIEAAAMRQSDSYAVDHEEVRRALAEQRKEQMELVKRLEERDREREEEEKKRRIEEDHERIREEKKRQERLKLLREQEEEELRKREDFYAEKASEVQKAISDSTQDKFEPEAPFGRQYQGISPVAPTAINSAMNASSAGGTDSSNLEVELGTVGVSAQSSFAPEVPQHSQVTTDLQLTNETGDQPFNPEEYDQLIAQSAQDSELNQVPELNLSGARVQTSTQDLASQALSLGNTIEDTIVAEDTISESQGDQSNQQPEQLAQVDPKDDGDAQSIDNPQVLQEKNGTKENKGSEKKKGISLFGLEIGGSRKEKETKPAIDFKFVDCLINVLPVGEDSPENLNVAIEMLEKVKEQDCDHLWICPKFNSNDSTVQEFMEKRSKAFREVLPELLSRQITYMLGAEVLIDENLGNEDDLKPLCLGNQNYLTISLGEETTVSNKHIEIISKIKAKFDLVPVIVHAQNLDIIKDASKRDILRATGCKFCVDLSAFEEGYAKKRLLVNAVNEGGIDFFATAAHNMLRCQPVISPVLEHVVKAVNPDALARIAQNSLDSFK